MADTYEILYKPVPESLSGQPAIDSAPARESSLKSFLGANLASSEKKEIDDEFKKTYPIHKQKASKINKPQPRLIEGYLHEAKDSNAASKAILSV
jgi:hypothetical protein